MDIEIAMYINFRIACLEAYDFPARAWAYDDCSYTRGLTFQPMQDSTCRGQVVLYYVLATIAITHSYSKCDFIS